MKSLWNSPLSGGSATPGLEGAPCSRSHQQRSTPTLSPPSSPAKPGKEAPSSKP